MKKHPARQQILDFVVSHYIERGYAPSIREVSMKIGISLSGCYHHLRVLTEAGYFIVHEQQARAFIPTELAYKELGRKHLSRNLIGHPPALAEENIRLRNELQALRKLYEAQLEASAHDQRCLLDELNTLRQQIDAPP